MEYQPGFVAETGDTIYMLEAKARKDLDDPIVLSKKRVAVEWCKRASGHAASYKAKPWRYVLIPHDAIAENMTLDWPSSSVVHDKRVNRGLGMQT